MKNTGTADQTLEKVCELFRIEGEMTGYQVICMGNINQTYRVDFRRADGTEKSYILQKINTYVFQNPRQIMHNIDLVTEFIHDADPTKKCLHFHHTENRKNFYFDGEGNFWRLCNYIESKAFDTSDDPKIMRGAGEAFGRFQTMLSTFDASSLYETIPDFHNTKKRIETFFTHVEEDPFDRVHEVYYEIGYIAAMRHVASQLTDMLEEGLLPLRVTHNDTKINNVLFDKNTHEALCVIDLDTVMPGLSVHDFGDAVRAACSTAAEDERDLHKVSLDLDKYRAFTEGFISQTATALTKEELDTMALGAFTLAMELSVRFLDDYISGDKYFKTRYPGHNLDRARCQMKLAQDMYSKQNQMKKIVHQTAAAAKKKAECK